MSVNYHEYHYEGNAENSYHRRKKKESGKRSVTMLVVGLAVIALLVGVVDWLGGRSDLPFSGSGSEVSTSGVVYDDNWELLLVNAENAVPDHYDMELTVLDNGETVDSRIYPSLQAMFDDARAAGVYPLVTSGYRTAEEQQQQMEDKIAWYMEQGCTKQEAEEDAAYVVSAVGYSEHQLGNAVDINADKTKSDNEQVYAWLLENAADYGFILRYPQEKSEVTGILYEPWHYRYVGKEAAVAITAEGLCLEEYLAAQ